ncbi:MAG: transglutaminase domain-containing protein [Candidatus Desantisbacteria bacterium]
MLKKVYRATIWVVLLTFGFQATGLGQIAYALNSGQQSTVSSQKKTTGEEWTEAISSLGEEVRSKKIEVRSLEQKGKELERVDKKLRKEFEETERFLKEKNLPDKILERHKAFVKQYEDNYARLKENLNKAITTKSTKELKEFIEKTQYKEKQRPIDPNKLPHRLAPKGKPIEPRITPTKQTKAIKSLSENYLSETIEIKITDEIKKLANETLKGNPVLIYEYIRNNFDFEPYYGSLKGSQQTLWEKAGNDFDLASLLIALYRAANIPARYVYGTIEIPIEKAMNWVGVKDPYTAAQVFASGGIPCLAITQGGKIVKIRLEHCWVEGYVTYDHYRGARQTSSHKIWVPLDPSFKQYNYTEGTDLSTLVPFDGEAFVEEIKGSATINENEGYVTGIDYALIQQRINEYRTNIENYLNAHLETTIDDLMGTKTIKRQNFGILFTTMPCNVISTNNRYSEIPDSLRHKIQFSVSNESIFEEEAGLSYTLNIPELAGKRITLSYIPATPEDEAIINSYLPQGSSIQPEDFPTNLPAYLFSLKPELKIEGITKAVGGQIGMGQDQTFAMNFIEPGKGVVDSVVNDIIAGEFYGVGLDVGKVSRSLLEERKAKLESIKTSMETNPEGTYSKDDFLGEILYIAGLGYFHELDLINEVQAKRFNVVAIRFPSEVIVSMNLNVSYIFGLPNMAKISGIGIDVDRDIYAVLPMDGNNARIKDFMVSAGMAGSALEHGILEQLFSTPENPVEALSAVKALTIANNQGIPIYTINSSNINQILPNLQVSSGVKTDIQNAINAGKVVTVSKTNITYKGWTGVGYIVMDPETGAAAYLITGGTAGAFAIIVAVAFALILLIIPVAAGAGIVAAIAALLGPFYVGFIVWLNFILDEDIREIVQEIVIIVIEAIVSVLSLFLPGLQIVDAVLLWGRFIEMIKELFGKHQEKHSLLILDGRKFLT